MAIEHQRTMTVEEYFRLEETDPDTRYEYIDGHVYAMAGGTANHDSNVSAKNGAGTQQNSSSSRR